MPQRKSVALYHRNLKLSDNKQPLQEYWLYSYSEFDTRGNLTEQSVYAQSGALLERTSREFDGNGFLKREKFFIEDEEPSEEKSYERNDDGILLKEYKHYTDGSHDTIVYNYDSQHRIISRITSDDEGEVEEKLINEFNGDFLVRTQIFDGDDNLLRSDEFSYNEQGNSVEHKKIDNESGELSVVVTTYNSNGHKLKETHLDEDGDEISETNYMEDEAGRLLSLTEKSAEKTTETRFEYDERGNAVSQVETDEEGNELIVVDREFDDENNILQSEVFVSGQGRTPDQFYEIKFEYQFYQE
jgi:YD repeat-containing protein